MPAPTLSPFIDMFVAQSQNFGDGRNESWDKYFCNFTNIIIVNLMLVIRLVALSESTRYYDIWQHIAYLAI